MSKLSKLKNNPKLFFIDMAKKRMPKYKHKYGKASKKKNMQPTPPKNEEVKWFNETISTELEAALNSGKPVFLYIPWIQSHTNVLMEKLKKSDDFTIVQLDIFEGLNDNATRRGIARFAREKPELYRKMVLSRLIPIASKIKGMIFTFDWAPVMRICANVCEELEIPRILIPHESVFADRDKYYYDPAAGANVPLADITLGWGSLQKEIFTERGYPEDRFITVGSPKFDASKNYKPVLSKEMFYRIFTLDKSKPTILFATQPLDSQFDHTAARIAQRAAIADVLTYCNEHGAQLILRLPPSKDNILNAELAKRIIESGNASIDDSLCYLVPPEEAIYHSDIVVSINSTMLFEAALMGKPSISTKYLDFEQIWNNTGIPSASNADQLNELLGKLLADKNWQPSKEGMDWAAKQFSVGKFDGKACERIAHYLSKLANGDEKIKLRENPLQRLLFNQNDNSISIFGIHSQESTSKTSQLYLPTLLNCKKRVNSAQDAHKILKLSATDIFVQWGILPNNNKNKQNRLRRSLGRPLVFAEDGFIRSVGIGLSGTPGLSIILDDKTSYYNATTVSRLQMLLQDGDDLTAQQKTRAAEAIKKIVTCRVSKYNHAPDIKLNIGQEGRRKILLVDQRYGDQSVASGLADDETFKKMLDDAIEKYSEYDILIKRHPDAIKGGKQSYYSNENIEAYANNPNIHLIDFDVNPFSLFDIVDEVFVATSGMGFEALMAGKKVHCYGVPYYSGWGATNDYQQTPLRTRHRCIEDIFHFAYIVLSRYYSPALERRCSVEELADYIYKQINNQ